MKLYHVVRVLLLCAGSIVPCYAWGPQGHQTVGAIADELLAGTPAGKEVSKLLHRGKLQQAALWPDCAKGVKRKKSGKFYFFVDPRYTECAAYETKAGQQAMVAFVRRNWDGCHPAADEEQCPNQYHYADVAIERDSYERADVGTSNHDVVSAINAAVAVLKGQAAPAPFKIASQREALRMLAHYVGDVHQPLHVGAIYLSPAGSEVDPDHATFDAATKTRGGNLLQIGPKDQLHGEWDSIPDAQKLPQFLSEGVAAARLVPVTGGPAAQWAAAWATESVVASHAAFADLSYGTEMDAGKQSQHWPTTEPAGYAATRAGIQKQQLVKAGARLAQLLQAIFP
jgi:hypothetical protein